MFTNQQALTLTATQAQAIAAREYDGAYAGSIGAELARNAGADFTIVDWEIAYDAVTQDHGPIADCACALAGSVCDLNALRNYCKTQLERARRAG